jgi:hypothetical protein
VLLIIGTDNRHEELKEIREKRQAGSIQTMTKGTAHRYYFETVVEYRRVVILCFFVRRGDRDRKAMLLLFVIFFLFPLSGVAGYLDGRDDDDREINGHPARSIC